MAANEPAERPRPRSRIFAIDDDPIIIELIRCTLDGHGHDVTTFDDPRQALDAIRAEPPDLVLTDLSMPGLSGLDVIDGVRAVSATLPVIVISGDGDEEKVLECFSRGANDYMAKPFNTAEVNAKISLLLARSRRGLKAGAFAGARDAVERTVVDRFAGYRLLRRVGEGGMGVVYEAEAPDGKRVALKMLSHAISADRILLARFIREAEVLRSVSHPNIAAFLRLGQEDLKYFLAMEYIDGPDLDVWLRGRSPQPGGDGGGGFPLPGRGAIPEAEARALVVQIARALEALHRRGIVHRDLKPSNVMVAPGGVLKLVDFGLAKRASDDRLTATNAYLGTLHYMAPEMARDGGHVDIRADLYALGVIFFLLVTGRRPFESTSPAMLVHEHAYDAPPDPRTLVQGLGEETASVILKLLRKSPAERFQTPGQVLAAL